MSSDGADPREATAAFLLALRERGIGDLGVLRAMETVPRELFVPHRYIDLASRDIALPIACGQTMPEPFLVARMMEALQLTPQMRVLEVGAGSGYATAILARLSRDVLAVERFQSLAISAKACLARLGIVNASIVWGDGLGLSPHPGLFERILVHAAVEGHEERFLGMLSEGGVVVCAKGEPQHLVQLHPGPNGRGRAAAVCPSRMRPLLAGKSQGL